MAKARFAAVGLIVCAAIAATAMARPPAEPARPRADLSDKDYRRIVPIVRPATDFSKPEAFERMQGGAATWTAPPDGNAFSNFSANLSFEGQEKFKLGNGIFKKVWVSAPSSTQASDGLGPLFNARACQRCHLKDGRGHPPESPDAEAVSMFLRLSVPPATWGERRALKSGRALLIPDPVYGGQLQDLAVPGLAAEGRMRIDYEEIEVALGGGETANLRKPIYSVTDLAYGPMADNVILSPRIAPPMIGLGLLEAVHEDDILARADIADADGDGISGKPSFVRDTKTGKRVLARFGWKASAPSVRDQSAGAFSGDMGISTPLAPDSHGDCTKRQGDCRAMPTGVQARLGDTEAPDPVLDLVDFYARNLAVPARRGEGEDTVLRGKAVFYQSGCASCHAPKYVTRRDAPEPEHQFQLIWPYTDLLLHDMGEGLADGQTAGDATGTEWRTAPLWGIGLTQRVNGHTFFLHDGRARNLLEAILWHGGEAQAARDTVSVLPPDDRAALIAFLESL